LYILEFCYKRDIGIAVTYENTAMAAKRSTACVKSRREAVLGDAMASGAIEANNAEYNNAFFKMTDERSCPVLD
jgi:hypothetical protein